MDTTASVLFSHFTSAALVVWLIQVLKKASWFPWLSIEGQVWTKRIVSIAGAVFAHLGIATAWHAGTAAGTHILMITIPSWPDLATSAWRILGQYVTQEGWYQVVYNKLNAPGNPLPPPQAQSKA